MCIRDRSYGAAEYNSTPVKMTAAVAYVFISNVADRMLLCIVGVLLSCYSLHVEVQHEKNSSYVAACDFNEHMSCSRVLTSKYVGLLR